MRKLAMVIHNSTARKDANVMTKNNEIAEKDSKNEKPLDCYERGECHKCKSAGRSVNACLIADQHLPRPEYSNYEG